MDNIVLLIIIIVGIVILFNGFNEFNGLNHEGYKPYDLHHGQVRAINVNVLINDDGRLITIPDTSKQPLTNITITHPIMDWVYKIPCPKELDFIKEYVRDGHKYRILFDCHKKKMSRDLVIPRLYF